MIVLGISGGPDLVHENLFGFTPYMAHDSACVLVENGEVLFGIEEERLNRIKHTNKFPAQSIRFCLDSRGIRLPDVDLIAYYSNREFLDLSTKKMYLANLEAPVMLDAVTLIQGLVHRALGSNVEPAKFRFVHHHYAHAISAFTLSGFDNALILTLDGQGDNSSGMVLIGEGNAVESIADFPVSKSLGLFYVDVIAYLGYKQFDEYKVMGLAPYGDPSKYRKLFKTFYTLLAEGGYIIHQEKLLSLFDVGTTRRRWEPFTQAHMDVAASLQEALEDIVLHVIRHYKQLTKQKHLCLAGGVAHNCTLNGKILDSGLFENVFVQPAAHDAGGALGSALYAYHEANPGARKPERMRHVYFGAHIGNSQSIMNLLTRWKDFLTFKKADDICHETAKLLAAGSVTGWVQGCSEFGPRALGNRSILADPRPPENKDRINRMVKKREGYRPFAPSVLEEDAGQFFEVPNDKERLPFMIFVVRVKMEKRALLGAVTHVDGTARLHTVSRKTNERFWNLVDAFKRLTGVPVLLNTSFNNNAEPIVDSAGDAIVSFLTTAIDHLVIGDYLIRKREVSWRDYLSLRLSLPPHITLHKIRKTGPNGMPSTFLSLQNTYDAEFYQTLSPAIFRTLALANGKPSLREIIAEVIEPDERKTETIVRELLDMWSQRLVILEP